METAFLELAGQWPRWKALERRGHALAALARGRGLPIAPPTAGAYARPEPLLRLAQKVAIELGAPARVRPHAGGP